MIGLIAVEIEKVRTTRFWIGLLLGGVALVTLGVVATLAIAGSPEGLEAGITPIETLEDVREFIATGSIVGVFALVLGATTMTTEHRHRTLSGTFLATPTRTPVVIAKVIGSALAGAVFGAIGALIPLVAVAITFVYLWLPYMVLPVAAGMERIPASMLEASADLGGRSWMTFRRVILPLTFPAVVAGSIFTFSLTLGDYIVPTQISTEIFIGNAIYANYGAGNFPLAAALTVLPLVVILVYLMVARRLGAFEAL